MLGSLNLPVISGSFLNTFFFLKNRESRNMGKYYSQALKTLILSIMNGDSGTELVLKKEDSYISGSKWEFMSFVQSAHLSCQVCFSGCKILSGALKPCWLTNTPIISVWHWHSTTDIPHHQQNKNMGCCRGAFFWSRLKTKKFWLCRCCLWL